MSLLKKGEIYMNTYDFFRDCDKNTDRTDPDEGLVYREYMKDAEITLYDINKDIEKDGITMKSINLRINSFGSQKGNIYSMSGLTSEHINGSSENININISKFGEALIIIHNPRVFIERVVNGLKQIGFTNVSFRKVTYYENEYTGELNIFHKNKFFQHQNEFRLYVPNTDNVPIKFEIGNLEDIAEAFTGGNVLKLTLTDGEEKYVYLPCNS
ncbi:hypothetical protein [Dyadobacter sp. NIV53]|uniref:hypothetical protein n=1 Tax=Dyadobacter sp. NIV53 TaxID=2861765 RepID=UPI001C867F6F|nr:hypothetical protein [Dyadobacter sp. NIV53]